MKMNLDRRQFVVGTMIPFIVGLPEVKAAVPPVEETPYLISTGFSTLDKALGGGLLPGESMLVCGEAQSGKTSFIHTIATASKKPVKIIDRHPQGFGGTQDSLYLHANADPMMFVEMTMKKTQSKWKSDLETLKKFNFVTVISDKPEGWTGHERQLFDHVVYLGYGRKAILLHSKRYDCRKNYTCFTLGFNMHQGCHEIITNPV